MHFLGEGSGAGYGAHVGRNHHKIVVVVVLLVKFGEEIIHKQGIAQHMIQRNVEKALDLRRVQIHGQDPVGACGGEHIGHQLGGDGVTSLGFAILPGIAEIGDDRRDPSGGGTAQSVDHDQQLHEMVIDGLAGGLHHKYVSAAHRLVHPDADLAVGKGGNFVVPQWDVQLFADAFCKRAAGIGTKDLDLVAVNYHGGFLSWPEKLRAKPIPCGCFDGRGQCPAPVRAHPR